MTAPAPLRVSEVVAGLTTDDLLALDDYRADAFLGDPGRALTRAEALAEIAELLGHPPVLIDDRRIDAGPCLAVCPTSIEECSHFGCERWEATP